MLGCLCGFTCGTEAALAKHFGRFHGASGHGRTLFTGSSTTSSREKASDSPARGRFALDLGRASAGLASEGDAGVPSSSWRDGVAGPLTSRTEASWLISPTCSPTVSALSTARRPSAPEWEEAASGQARAVEAASAVAAAAAAGLTESPFAGCIDRKVRLILIRHAQSANKRREEGQRASKDPGLSDLGLEQAEALAPRLQEMLRHGVEDGTVLVVSSPMRRCLLTARPAVRALLRDGLRPEDVLCHGACFEYGCAGLAYKGSGVAEIAADFPEFRLCVALPLLVSLVCHVAGPSVPALVSSLRARVFHRSSKLPPGSSSSSSSKARCNRRMVVSAAEPNATVLRRRWTSTWDAVRFAGQRQLHKPAFLPDVCTAQFELAAQAVVRLRDVVGKSSEEEFAIPLEGRSAAALEAAVDGVAGSLPHPVRDPTGFVRELIHAALQTGDGEYALGLKSAQAVEALLEQHCADLIEASGLLLDPRAAQASVDNAMAELQAAVKILGGSLPSDGSANKEESFKLSAALLLLSRDVRRLAENAGKALAIEAPSSPTRTVFDAAATSGEGHVEAGVLPHPPPEETPAANDGEGVGTPLRRTKSQFIKNVKVEEVAKVAEERREPVKQLRRLLSQLDKPHEVASDEAAQAARYEEATKELKEVQRLQQSFRNFGEDLMEGMLALDGITGLAEADRQRRKDTIRSIQGLLDEIDAAKPRVAKMHQTLAKEIDTLHHAVPAPGREHSQANQNNVTQQAPQQPEAPQSALKHPDTNWEQVKLPLKFSSAERPQAYTLSASVPGLEPDSISLKVNRDGVLSVAGLRLPTSQEQRQLAHMLSDHVQRLPASRRALLQQPDIDNMAVQLGHGRFGRFVEEFELPRDARQEEIECTYADGVLCVVIPRHLQPLFGGAGMPQLNSLFSQGARMPPLGTSGYPAGGSLFDMNHGLMW